MKKIAIKLLFLFILLLSTMAVSAHSISGSYIFLKIYETSGIDGRFEFNVNDINKVFNLNLPKDASVEDIKPYVEIIKAYLLEHSNFKSSLGEHKVLFDDLVEVLRIDYGNYMQFNFHLSNMDNLPDELDVFYDGVFDVDDRHRGFLTVEHNWKGGVINNEAVISLYFTPDDPTDTLSLNDSSAWKGFVAMIKQGVWHIWIGLDHILFLVALILPSVVRRRRESEENTVVETIPTTFNFFGWEPVLKFKPAFIYIVKIITFFTIAHTITLTLASLELVNLPSRIVESIIALSIGLAAYHNIKPIFKGKDWLIAFIFGLFHGFGFASVLSDLGLTSEYLTLSLLGFNIGVEIGQFLIIAGIFPILFFLRKTKIYPKLLIYGSIFLIIVSLYWVTERVFDVSFGVEQFIKVKLYEFAVYLGLK